ncbi:hypothetical protein [Nocardia sp. NBC_01388]|uniref:hypothetical protein n=1 Tax=Nocardia sp. NBC_01388 TaxID=2903596 RepID=UPI00324E0691
MPDQALITEPDWSKVRTVADEHGSHVEPHLDGLWPHLWQLRWLAAVISETIGTTITIHEDEKSRGPGRFGISYRNVGTAQTRTFDSMWSVLVGMQYGHGIARARIDELEEPADTAAIAFGQQYRNDAGAEITILEPVQRHPGSDLPVVGEIWVGRNENQLLFQHHMYVTAEGLAAFGYKLIEQGGRHA